jgi:hypothetical protein
MAAATPASAISPILARRAHWSPCLGIVEQVNVNLSSFAFTVIM